MPCTYRKADGTVCGAEVNNQANGKPFSLCKSCSDSVSKETRERRFKTMNRGVVLCNYVGYMPDATRLPYKCIAGANQSGFCFHHSKFVNTSVAPTPSDNNGQNNKAPVAQNKNFVKGQLVKLDESEPEDFGVTDVINKLKENKKALSDAKNAQTKAAEPKNAESKVTDSKNAESKNVETKTPKSSKSKIAADDDLIGSDDDVNIEIAKINEDDLKAKKAEEKAARKAEKAKLLEKIAAKEARKKAREEAAKKLEESESSEESEKSEKPKSKKKPVESEESSSEKPKKENKKSKKEDKKSKK